jgi:dTDP-4-amino-4,6-dideoxygalactose transaminase
MHIPFNKPFVTGNEIANVSLVMASRQFAGNGPFSSQCESWFETRISGSRAFLVNSCTAALEMSALLCDIKPGDEVIMPSYTFVSTASAFVSRGAVPVFIDIREDTLNINERLIEAAITDRTRAIVVVHYAGVPCDMDEIIEIGRRYRIRVVEDAAQAILSKYKGRLAGGIGSAGCVSFHETKNIVAGEGGMLLVNEDVLASRAEIIREKGTNRARFFRGQVDKYTWVDLGSSFLVGEIPAAFLSAQLAEADVIMQRRLSIWNYYHCALSELEQKSLVRRPIVPSECEHNGHIYYLLMPCLASRSKFIELMKAAGIQVVFHYVPLHSSPYGRQVGRTSGSMAITNSVADRLVRLPIWVGLETQLESIVDNILSIVLKKLV